MSPQGTTVEYAVTTTPFAIPQGSSAIHLRVGPSCLAWGSTNITFACHVAGNKEEKESALGVLCASDNMHKKDADEAPCGQEVQVITILFQAIQRYTCLLSSASGLL